MAADVEWIPPEGESAGVGRGGDGADELFDLGKEPARPSRFASFPHRVPLVARAVGLLAVIAAVVGYGLASHSASRLSPDAALPKPAAEQIATDRAMALIEASARSSRPAQDYIRSNSTRGACALVAVGHSPQATITSAIHRALPEYTLRDVSRTIDQFTALCAIRVRAVDPHGSVLVVDVAAPEQAVAHEFTALTVGARLDADNTVSIATALTRTGWSITVGAVGPLSDEPSSADLQRLSQDAGLLW